MQANRKHDGEHPAMAAAHEGHGGGKTSDGHAGHDRHAGHTIGMFHNRFWVSLVLSVPVVLYSDMIQMWLGFSMRQLPGSGLFAPVLGTFIFLWGGWPFLKGGFEEAREWRPGMMLLISMAITVAFVPFCLAVFRNILAGTWEVALVMLHLRPLKSPGIVAVPIGERTPTGVAVWALVTGLPPGSFFVDVNRGRGVALIHVIDARDPEAVREQHQDFYRRYQGKVFP